jgi:hypothetical protein
VAGRRTTTCTRPPPVTWPEPDCSPTRHDPAGLGQPAPSAAPAVSLRQWRRRSPCGRGGRTPGPRPVARAPPVVAAPIGNRTQRRPAHERPGASAQLPRAAAQHVDAQRCPKRWTTPHCFDPRTRCGRCSERTGGKATGATERRTSRANAFASSNLTCSPVTAEPAAMASAEPNPVDEQHAIGVAARGTAHLSGAHGRLAGRDEAERAVWAHDPQGRCDPAGRDRTVDSSAETEGPSLPLEAARTGPPLAGSCAPLRELPAGRRAMLGGLGAPP